MAQQLILSKNSVGVGDRFAHQAEAQLRACLLAAAQGVDVIPVWNKSNREHNIIGSEPASVRAAADAAAKSLGWTKPYHVDADHINFDTVDRFLDASDFYTIDVADWIGKPPAPGDLEVFVNRHTERDRQFVTQTAVKYLAAVKEAGRIYRKIENKKGRGNFIPEVSMDETDAPQTPDELLIILAAIADEGIPVQTIAPKFTGRFSKGVDYEGDLEKFAEEFADDIAAIALAVERYNLPRNLKLSVHSGSDKFSIYRPMRQALKKFHAGVHLKTAGTTWLEELIGLAEAGGEGLALAKEIYSHAYEQREALCGPYAAVISIDPQKLPSPSAVSAWTSDQFISALRHDQRNPEFNSNFRQLLHVGFKVAAKMGQRYLDQLKEFAPSIARNVTENLFDRHIKPVFLDN
ncbi:MAG TPA: tagaturonate epimerase family protein [Bryobacteraceae bacterium]